MRWIGIDWGTSNLRAWSFDKNDEIIGTHQSNDGMGRLSSSDYPEILNKILAVLDQNDLHNRLVDVVICGMAGAKQGWKEASYLSLPLDLSTIAHHGTNVDNAFAIITILPGVAQRMTGQNDVMRGEETQLLGLCESMPAFSGRIAMPGTHSKWATLKMGILTEFQTVMTGELYDILCNHSVLRHSMPNDLKAPLDQDGLSDGLKAGMDKPEMLQTLLFKTRAAALVSGKTNNWSRSYLSGLLVGAEVKTNAPDEPQHVPIIGSKRLVPIYTQALQMLGHTVLSLDATHITISGLKLAHRQITEKSNNEFPHEA